MRRQGGGIRGWRAGGKSKGGTEGEREEERGKRETDCAAGLPCK